MDKQIDDFLNDISEALPAVAPVQSAVPVAANSKVQVAAQPALQPSQVQAKPQVDPATQQKNIKVAAIQNQIAQASSKLAQLQQQLANELKK